MLLSGDVSLVGWLLGVLLKRKPLGRQTRDTPNQPTLYPVPLPTTSHRLQQVVYILTMVTSAFMPAQFLTGVFG